MTDDSRKVIKMNIEKVAHPLIIFFNLFGFWQPQDKSLAYKLYGISILIFCTVSIGLPITISIFLSSELGEFSNSLWTTCLIWVTLIRLFRFYISNEKMFLILRRIEQMDVQNDKEKALIDQRLKFVFRSGIFIFSSTCSSAVVFFPHCLITRTLPFPAYYPFLCVAENFSHFFLVWIHQGVAIMISMFLLMAIEIYFCLALSMISTRLDIIGMRLKKIGYEKCDKIVYYQNLIILIKFHLDILEFYKSIKKLFSFSYFCQGVVSGIMISSIIVVIVLVRKM